MAKNVGGDFRTSQVVCGKGGAACVSARVDARSVREAIAGSGQCQRTALCREMRLMPSRVQSSFADRADVAGADGCDAGENRGGGAAAANARGAERNSHLFAAQRGRVVPGRWRALRGGGYRAKIIVSRS